MADSNEKSFNDEELADIMSEIESLESELVEDEDLSEVVSVESKDDKPVEKGDSKVSKLPVKGKSETSISFDVQGDMRFNLGFVIDGKALNVYVDADSEGLVVEMEGGMKLNVPFSNSKAA